MSILSDDEKSSGRAGSDRGEPSLGDLSWRQRALLLLVVLAGTVAALAAVEAGLRLAGVGHGYPLFVEYEPRPSYLTPNPRIGQRYFPDPRNAPSPHDDLFHAEKKESDFRVFVQGGSAAAGFPWYHGGSFSRMLEDRLQESLTGRNVEVVNVALGATNSYTVLDLADEIAAQEPDAVIVYAGHNEYYGAYGVASSVSLGRHPALIRAYLELRRFRLVQLLGSGVRALRGVFADQGPRRPRTMMERLARDQSVRWGTDRWRAGVSQFRRNLDALLGRYREADVPVLVGTLASNLRDLPPFRGTPAAADSGEWNRRMRRAGEAVSRADTAAALEALGSAIRADSSAANAFYARGHLLDGLGRTPAARESYADARDRDLYPFRAPSAVNRVIREEAEEHGAVVVPVLERLEAGSPAGIVGDSLMLEHLHPTVHGQLLIADAFYRALRERTLPGGWGRAVSASEARGRVPVTALDSLYGRMVISRLTAGWPFRDGDPTVSLADTLRASTRVEELAVARTREGLAWAEATHRLRDHYTEEDRYRRAIHVDRVLAQSLPFTGRYHTHAGRLALRLGDRRLALELFRTAFRREETADAARMIGGLLAATGRRDSAARYFERAAELAPDDRQATAALKAFRALPELQRRVESAPEDPDALTQLGAVYLLTGQYRRARTMVRRALEQAPGHARARDLSNQLEGLPLPEADADSAAPAPGG